ncbi:hypothetical protein EXN66_Car012174 [Channa argus]|uniref:Uncharacterized protein n=1 Tax=Channa argus TaxID=215402 RepID=A0A6G1Q2S5_CHAAH|nr:hypothetical protein EXN66_Car012174 [Channa argus]
MAHHITSGNIGTSAAVNSCSTPILSLHPHHWDLFFILCYPLAIFKRSFSDGFFFSDLILILISLPPLSPPPQPGFHRQLTFLIPTAD